MKNRIAFDFDGVICDSYNLWRGHYFDTYGVNISREDMVTGYELSIVESPFYEESWWRQIPVAIARYQHIAPPVHGSLEALEAISKKYGEIMIISAREPSAAVMEPTLLWCRQNFNFDFDMHFCSEPEQKDELIDHYGVQYFVDDRFKTAMHVIDLPTMKGSFIFEHFCNKDYGNRPALKTGVYRVKSLFQMKNFLDSQLTDL